MVIYELMINQAEKKGRFPHNAKAVLDEICLRMKEDLKESLLNGQCRLDKEFLALNLGNRSHSEFRARFEEKIISYSKYFEEKMDTYNKYRDESWERMNRFSEKLDALTLQVEENSRTVAVINKLFWVAIVAASGAIAAQIWM